MMSDNVTITELADGALVVQRIGLPDGVIYPEVAAALRAHFAERADALAAVVDAIRHNWRTQKPELFHGVTKQIIDGAQSDVLAARDSRIRAEVIDWIDRTISNDLRGPAVAIIARQHFELPQKGADHDPS